MEFGQSLSQKSKIFDSSLYTREPLAYGIRWGVVGAAPYIWVIKF